MMQSNNKIIKFTQLVVLFFHAWAIGCVTIAVGIGIGLFFSALCFPMVHYFGKCALTPLLRKQMECFICSTLVYAMPLLYCYLYKKKKALLKLMRLSTYSLKYCMYTVIATTVVTILLNLWMDIQSQYFSSLFGKPIKSEIYFSGIGHFICYGILHISFLVPITEELLFRVILPQRIYAIIKKKWLACIMSSAVFSMLHGHLANSLYYFIAGCFYSYLYHKTNHIIYPILAHAMTNLTVSCLIYYGVY